MKADNEIKFNEYGGIVKNGDFNTTIHFMADQIEDKLILTIDIKLKEETLLDGDLPYLSKRQIKILIAYLNALVDADEEF
jgi:hypothetical protein